MNINPIGHLYWIKMRLSLYSILLSICLVFFSCKKEETPAPSLAPEIKFVNVYPETVKEYNDKLEFTFIYSDPDGDLGENNANVSNLFLTDNRNQVIYKYRIKQLAPENSNVKITGVLSIELKNTVITDNSTSQKTTYSIYVEDRAGNTSNTINTSEVTITK